MVIFCLAKNPLLMPRKSGATSMTPLVPKSKVTGVVPGVAVALDAVELAPPQAASITTPARTAVRRAIVPRISPPAEGGVHQNGEARLAPTYPDCRARRPR